MPDRLAYPELGEPTYADPAGTGAFEVIRAQGRPRQGRTPGAPRASALRRRRAGIRYVPRRTT